MKRMKILLFVVFASALTLFTAVPIGMLAASSSSKAKEVKTEHVRVQFLSDTVLRIEESNGGIFEDRDTLIIVGRDEFEGIEASVSESADEIVATTDKYKVVIKKDSKLSDGAVTVYSNDDSLLWDRSKSTESFYTELPTPSDSPEMYAIADDPRIIEPPHGMVYKGIFDIYSGYQENSADDFYIFMPGGDAKTLRSDFVRLTGRTDISDIKTFGSWYSRYQAWSDTKMLSIIDSYRNAGFPLDVLVVDTDWRVGASTGYNVNTALFPDMKSYISSAQDKGVLTIFNDHTHTPAGHLLLPNELKYHTENLQYHMTQNGLHGWWYDRNWHNALRSPYPDIQFYTLGQVMYHDIIDDANGDKRVFLLSNLDWVRDGSIEQGPSLIGHRYGIQWTGDITSESLQLREELRLLVHGSAVGSNPYISSDLGGHKRAREQSSHMYACWMQYGALSPVFRIHSYGAEATDITKLPYDAKYTAVSDTVRNYMNMRYNLLPHFYSLAHDNYETGMPLVRRLDFYYPEFEESKDETQYLLGEDILVAPIWSHYGEGDDVVPESWFDGIVSAKYYNNKTMSGNISYATKADKIDFNWGNGSPAHSVTKDNFSAVFEGKITPTDDCYIGVVSDDGAKVYINGELYVDNWKASWLESKVATSDAKMLKAGTTYDLKVEYYEAQNGAACKLIYQKVTPRAHTARDVFIPSGEWIDAFTGEKYTGPQTIRVTHSIKTSPIFIRVGGIVPTSAAVSPIAGADYQQLSLNIYAGGSGSYILSEDDGETENYQNGDVRKTEISHISNESGGNIDISAVTGNFTTSYENREWRVRIHSDKKILSATLGGKSLTITEITKSEDSFPFADTGASPDANVYEITFSAPLSEKACIQYSYNESAGNDSSGSKIKTVLLTLSAIAAALSVIGVTVAFAVKKKNKK